MAIEDFGKKIGGARKDLWASRGLRIEDIADFNTAERAKYITKNNIWPKPDYEKMLEEGYSRDVVYFIKSVRDAMPTSPELKHSDSTEKIQERQEDYISHMTDLKEKLLEIKEDKDINNLSYDYFVNRGLAEKHGYGYNITDEGYCFVTSKLFKTIQMNSGQAEREAGRKDFLGNNVYAIKAQFSIHQLDDNYSVEPSYSNASTVCIKQQRYGGASYFYARNAEFSQLLRERDLSTYNGNYLIVHQGNIIGLTHDHAQAQDYVMSKAQKIADEKAGIAEEKKAANKETTAKKKGLVPPILAHIERQGPETHIADITGQDFLDVFKIKGGEFGNWLNEAEKQTNMNMAFDSFKDLAKALNINDEDISMGGRLNMAFGSRGRKGAAAHYEPLREVINLTKMKGAGSLAHEFFHGMDDISGKEMGVGKFATEAKSENSFTELAQVMKYREAVITPEEQNKELDNLVEERINKFKSEIKKMVPDQILDEEKTKQRDQLIKDLIDKAKGPEFSFIEYEFTRSKMKKTVNPIINDLSKYIDTNAKYYKMTPGNREWLAGQLKIINDTYNRERATEPVTRKVETEFYKDAKAIDNAYSKSTHGYWQSTIELAARAFACYVHDKLEEKGIKNDYLTGHAFFSAIGESGRTYKIYPDKDEREVINKTFDKIVEAMKEYGIFHERVDKELAVSVGDNFIAIQASDSGYDYSILDKDYNLLDGGIIENIEITIQEALTDIKNGLNYEETVETKEVSYERTIAEMEKREEEKLRAARAATLGDIPDVKECKQLTLDDMLNQAYEMKAEKETKAEKEQHEALEQKQSERQELVELRKEIDKREESLNQEANELSKEFDALKVQGLPLKELFKTEAWAEYKNKKSDFDNRREQFNKVGKTDSLRLDGEIAKLDKEIASMNGIKEKTEKKQNRDRDER